MIVVRGLSPDSLELLRTRGDDGRRLTVLVADGEAYVCEPLSALELRHVMALAEAYGAEVEVQ